MDQVCRFSQGIINFRIGTRGNNAALMASAKYMTKEIFHARNHPKYQQIEMYDHIQYLIMPDEVKQQSDRFASITTSGHNSTGEDLDFVLEEKNKQLKQWISKGVPTDAVWQKICRNNTVLQTLKVNLYSLEKNYLWEHKDEHFSIDGHILDFDLVNLIERASAKRVYLLKTQYLNDDIDIPNMSYPIPVTPQERDKFEDINNQTKAQIAKEISYCMEMLPEGEMHDYFEVCFKKVKAGKKTEYLSFLAELRDVIRSGLAEDADEVHHHNI
ncbi:unnamed protein product [Mytilus edulis]|uniref:Uncharacterized protein n=1 Tax=Mytilus edulis TaxID=6550 RepID=A0A8S3PRR2_MYTED|nr:unnamed protein product [Mytilus edulis]